MKVFISWSGEISKKAAEAIKEWLEQCIQSLEVFFSSEDIEKGINWQTKLTNELNGTNYGIVCLTSENVTAPWIHFEAGALSKMLDSKVMVVTINIKISDIVGPLTSFQATKIEEKDVFKLLQSINKTQEKPLPDDKLQKGFNAFWPELKNKLDDIIESAPAISKSEKITKTSNAHVNEVLDEILQLVRSQNSYITRDLVERLPDKLSSEDKIDDILHEIFNFTNFILRQDDKLVTDRFLIIYKDLVSRLSDLSGNRIFRKGMDRMIDRYLFDKQDS